MTDGPCREKRVDKNIVSLKSTANNPYLLNTELCTRKLEIHILFKHVWLMYTTHHTLSCKTALNKFKKPLS